MSRRSPRTTGAGQRADEAVELIRYADMNECLTSDLNGDPDFVYPNAADCRDALLSGSCVETDSGAPALSLPDECLGVDVPCVGCRLPQG